MKLSIITVNLNNCRGLKRTINSVVPQTFKDYEWIIIDGGSTDGSRELIEEYSSHFAYWVSEPDKGIYNAMNKGIARSKGDYLQFLNSGDWLLSPMTLEEVFSKQFSEDIIYGDIKLYECSRLIKTEIFPEVMNMDLLFDYSLGHNSCFIKKRLFMDHLYDESLRIVSDWKFFLQEYLEGTSFRHIDVLVGCFDNSGISGTLSEQHHRERQQVISEFAVELLNRKMIQANVVKTNLANVQLDEFNTLCARHILIRKAITALVLLMKRMK